MSKADEIAVHIQGGASRHRSRWSVCEAHMACTASIVTIHEGGYGDGRRLNLFAEDPAFWRALAAQAIAAAELLEPTYREDTTP